MVRLSPCTTAATHSASSARLRYGNSGTREQRHAHARSHRSRARCGSASRATRSQARHPSLPLGALLLVSTVARAPFWPRLTMLRVLPSCRAAVFIVLPSCRAAVLSCSRLVVLTSVVLPHRLAAAWLDARHTLPVQPPALRDQVPPRGLLHRLAHRRLRSRTALGARCHAL